MRNQEVMFRNELSLGDCDSFLDGLVGSKLGDRVICQIDAFQIVAEEPQSVYYRYAVFAVVSLRDTSELTNSKEHDRL